MALVKSTLSEKLSTFIDQDHPAFSGMPTNTLETSNAWADAVNTYASLVTPPSTTAVLAKAAFISIMNGLAPPVEEDPTADPFTMYYISPESKMNRFNNYLRTIGYKSDPSLDKTAVFTKLKTIRLAYNKQRPSVAFTDEDIYYNQARFNQIYAADINAGTRLKLKQDGVTVDSVDPFYSRIPVDPTGKVVSLQVDGIIGDDTIRYFPLSTVLVYEQNGSRKWNQVYSSLKFIHSSCESGDMLCRIPFKEANSDWGIQRGIISNFKVKQTYIDKGLMKDYTKIRLDKVQFQYDGGLADNPAYEIPMGTFISKYSLNHSTCDPAWGATSCPTRSPIRFKTIDEFINAKRLAAKTYKALPPSVKDGITVLQNAIKAYALELAIGMAPAFTGSNVSPLDLSPVVTLGMSGAGSAKCVTMLSNLIHVYFISGTATNNSSGATSPWS